MSHQSTELLPCPFCGSAATLKKGKTIMVSCTGCTASTFQTLGDKTSSIVGWNTRAITSVKREPQWLPIESAPKDGTALILAVVEDGIVCGVDHGHFQIVAEDEEDGPWDIRDGKPWCSYVGRSAGTYFCFWLSVKELDSTWEITNNFPYTHYMFPPPITASEEDGQ